ncbi:hypothetical protein HK102_010994 [Quaeritorhiza haematococci]|nr:hypothetical protein HK102_010994 [Quaeritorhiza haematococci]
MISARSLALPEEGESAVNFRAPLSPTMPKKIVPTLPFEIVETILPLVDAETKHSCALVSRMWASVARRELWNNISLHKESRIQKFSDLIQSQPLSTRDGDRAPLRLPKITSLITELHMELDPSTINLCCEILATMGPSLKTLSLSGGRTSYQAEHLCRIADFCPKSVKKLSMGWRIGTGGRINLPEDSTTRGDLELQRLHEFFRQFVDIQWGLELDVDLVLASIHEGLRVFRLGHGLTAMSREDLARIIRLLPPTLVAFDAGGTFVDLCGEGLVLLGKTCPNLKAFRSGNNEVIRSDHLEEFLSTLGSSLEFFSGNVFCFEDLQVIARHCPPIKHLCLAIAPPWLPPHDFEYLLRNVGANLLTFNVSIKYSRWSTFSIAKALIPMITNSCPNIQKVRIEDQDKTAVDEKDVQQLFSQCKKLLLMEHNLHLGRDRSRQWTRIPGARYHNAFFEFDEFVRNI